MCVCVLVVFVHISGVFTLFLIITLFTFHKNLPIIIPSSKVPHKISSINTLSQNIPKIIVSKATNLQCVSHKHHTKYPHKHTNTFAARFYFVIIVWATEYGLLLITNYIGFYPHLSLVLVCYLTASCLFE